MRVSFWVLVGIQQRFMGATAIREGCPEEASLEIGLEESPGGDIVKTWRGNKSPREDKKISQGNVKE